MLLVHLLNGYVVIATIMTGCCVISLAYVLEIKLNISVRNAFNFAVSLNLRVKYFNDHVTKIEKFMLKTV